MCSALHSSQVCTVLIGRSHYTLFIYASYTMLYCLISRLPESTVRSSWQECWQGQTTQKGSKLQLMRKKKLKNR